MLPFINKKQFASSIGFAVYAFEGIGIVLPIQDIAADQGSFRCMVFLTVISVAVLYIFFGNFCLNAFGTANGTNPLVSSFLEDYISIGDSDTINVNDKQPYIHFLIPDIIILLFMSNLVFTYPL